MESVGRLAGGVAHDFNNMLGVISGHAELALQEVDSTQSVYADLQEIHQAAQAFGKSYTTTSGFCPETKPWLRLFIDLNKTVEGMIKMLKRLIGEDIDLAWKPGSELWPVKIDPTQIDQMLANLCVNARDAIKDVGKITIETSNTVFDEDYCKDHQGFIPGEYVMLGVSDNGSGMDKEILDNIFEPFYTTKELGQGTGLGLSTVYGIVKQNDGFN